MSDRSSAYLFGEIFNLIVGYVPKAEQPKVAKDFWKMSRDYDFSDDQMHCDDQLIELGLAHKAVDPEYPEDGEVVIYEPPPKPRTT
jgi:hypothetical protein